MRDFVGIIITIAVLLWFFYLIMPYDDTDDIKMGERSGMTLLVDHGTGCQYLRAGFAGGLTPRLDGNGNHAGCRAEASQR